MFYTILAAFAEFERNLISERTKDGLAATEGRGRNGGRKPKLQASQIEGARQSIDDGEAVATVAKQLKVSRQTLYRSLARAASLLHGYRAQGYAPTGTSPMPSCRLV